MSVKQYWSDYPPGQDRWLIQRVFANRTTPGYFIEAGASDGLAASNTRTLEMELGWIGILCEPNIKFYERLRHNRLCITENCALVQHDGDVDFINAAYFGSVKSKAEQYAEGQDVLSLSKFAKDVSGQAGSISSVKGKSFRTLLKEHHSPTVIDYISLDIEGNEYEALLGFPFSEHVFLAMTIENYMIVDGKRCNHHHKSQVDDLLGQYGYIHVASEHVDDFYLHPSIVRSDLMDMWRRP